MELDTIAKHRAAFYRLVGSVSGDDAMAENAEAADDVCYLYLTRGYRAAQRYLIDFCGMSDRWRARTAALTWSGTEAADGGQYVTLPANFLRLWGDNKRSGLVEADGDTWGVEISPTRAGLTGQYYYLKNDQLWKTGGATPPSTVYLEYIFHHPAITSSIANSAFDMPMEARHLCIAFAANAAMLEGWFALEDRNVVREALAVAKTEAKQLRRYRTPLSMKPPVRYGTAW